MQRTGEDSQFKLIRLKSQWDSGMKYNSPPKKRKEKEKGKKLLWFLIQISLLTELKSMSLGCCLQHRNLQNGRILLVDQWEKDKRNLAQKYYTHPSIYLPHNCVYTKMQRIYHLHAPVEENTQKNTTFQITIIHNGILKIGKIGRKRNSIDH